MTNSHSVLQGSASDFLCKNRTKHPKLKYNRDFKRQMCPTLRYLLLLTPQEGGNKHLGPPCTEPGQRSSLSVPGYSRNLRSQHTGVHCSAFACLGSFRLPSCLLDWEGAGGQRRFCHGGITSPTAPTHPHLWDSKMALGRKGDLFPTAVAGGCVSAAINHFGGTSQCFPPCPSPLL